MAVQGKKGSKILPIFVLVIVLLGTGFGVYAKKITDPVQEKPKSATLHILSGSVTVQSAEDAAPREAHDGETLQQGDRVVTGKDAEAELVFFDESVARLSPESDIEFKKLEHDPTKPTEDKVSIFVNVGRVWSRVLNLLNLNAEYSIESSSTVATVRGTAFDFVVEKTPDGGWTHVNGNESIVDCKTKNWNGIVGKTDWLHVPDNADVMKASAMMKTMSKDAQKTLGEKGVVLGDEAGVSDSVKNGKWQKQNEGKDTTFEDGLREAKRREDVALARPLSLPIVGKVIEFVAEKRLEAAAPEHRADLAANWAARHIALANQLVEAGRGSEAVGVMDAMKKTLGAVEIKNAGRVQAKIDEGVMRGSMALKLGADALSHLPEVNSQSDEPRRMLMKSVMIEQRLRALEANGDSANDQQVEAQTDLGAMGGLTGVLKQRFDYLKTRRDELLKLRKGIRLLKPIDLPIEKLPEPTLLKPVPTLVPKVIMPIVKPKPEPTPTPTPVPAPEPTPEPAPVPAPEPKLVIEGMNSMQADQGARYKAVHIAPDGTRTDVTAKGKWSVSGTAGGSITSDAFYQSAMQTGRDTIVWSGTGPDGVAHTASKTVLVEPQIDMAP